MKSCSEAWYDSSQLRSLFGPLTYLGVTAMSNITLELRWQSVSNGDYDSIVTFDPCPSQFFVSVIPSTSAQCGATCNGVSDPINPVSGAVYVREPDLKEQRIGGLSRFYNSADASNGNLGAGWRQSFSRRIASIYTPTTVQVYAIGSPSNSSLYSDPSIACANGFAEIQSRVSTWVGATVQYVNGICELIKNGVVIGSIPVYSNLGVPVPLPTPIFYNVVRDDGRTLLFWQNSGVLRSVAGVSLRLQQTSNGFTVIDDNDNIETYDNNGVLQLITSRSGVTQTMSYDASSRLSSVTDSFGHRLMFDYDSQSHLSTVTRQ